MRPRGFLAVSVSWLALCLLGCGGRSSLSVGHGDAEGGATSVAGSAAISGSPSVGGKPSSGGAPGSGGAPSSGGSTAPDPCRPDSCDNGGRCLSFLGAAVCDCVPGTFGARCETRVEQIAAGYQHACALLSDGSVRCFGTDRQGEVSGTPSAKTFREVTVAGGCNPGGCTARSCGVHVDGKLECWGSAPGVGLPEGRFQHLALEVNDGRVSCAIDLDGSLVCSGLGAGYPQVALSGQFQKVLASYTQVCGLRPSGAIACWNVPDGYALPELPGPFRDLALEVDARALTEAGDLQCLDEPCADSGLADGPYTSLAAAAGFGGRELCAIREDGSLGCAANAHAVGRFDAVSVGTGLECGLVTGGGARCWSRPDLSLVGQALPPAGTFTSISAGTASSCGLRPDGRAECWGDSTDYSYYVYLSHRVLTQPPPSRFASLAIDDDLACGINGEQAIECWGDWRWDGRDPLPEGPFQAVFPECSCALDLQGAPVCWGAFKPTLPTGPLRALVCRGGQACALDAAGQLSCSLVSPESGTPPTARFSSVSAGFKHSCGIEASSSALRCWGDDTRGQASPPPGSFTDLSCGEAHCCAIDASQAVACWGANDFGQASPRPGAFKQVAAGSRHTCGLRVDGTVSCWGELFY